MHFSSRFHWDLRPNRLTQALAARRASGAPVIDLTESNPTHAGFEYPAEITRAFEDPRVLAYEPSPAGSIDAREEVSAYYAARGHRVTTDRILLTASTSEAYSYLFKLLCDPGDEVLVPRPSYPLFEFLADMDSVKVRQYALSYHGAWSMEVPEFGDRTRAVVLVNPNNPTGSYVKRGELAALAARCAERGVALISDEVFADFAFGADADRVATLVDLEECTTFCMSGLSKVAGLPQMKLGWMVANRAAAFERLEWIADTYLSVSTPVQCAASRLLKAGDAVQAQMRARTERNLAVARELLAGTAGSILAVEGGWYMTLQVPRVRTEEDWALQLLERDGVLVQPGFFYDFESEAFLVLSLLTETRAFRSGLEAIRKWL
jgi:aspartate/methionine/tyrosine aminotransferase